MRLVVAAGTLWVLFASGILLNVLGQRRLMRAADGLLAVEFAALVAANSLDSDGTAIVVALVVCPSVTGGFLAYCLQRAVRATRRDSMIDSEPPRRQPPSRGAGRRPEA